MATSPLYDGNIGGRRDRITERGHGTRALGPSDSSDTGSDLVGADGLGDDITDEFDHANMPMPHTAGPDVGDANLDADSDRTGTGERADAARDVPESADIHADRIEKIRPDEDA